MRALGLEGGQCAGVAGAAYHDKEIRKDFVALPALQSVILARNEAVPPFDGVGIIEIECDVTFEAIDVALIDAFPSNA